MTPLIATIVGGYVLILLLINLCFRGKITIGLISWLQVFFVHIYTGICNIRIGSITLTFHPFDILIPNGGAGYRRSLINISLRKIAVNVNRHPTSQQPLSGKTKPRKLHTRLLKFILRIICMLPTSVTIHQMTINHDKLSLGMHLSSFSVDGKIRKNKEGETVTHIMTVAEVSELNCQTEQSMSGSKLVLSADFRFDKDGIHADNVSISFTVNDLSIDLDEIVDHMELMDKSSSGKSSLHTFDNLSQELRRIKICDASFSLDHMSLKYRNLHFILGGLFFDIDSQHPENLPAHSSVGRNKFHKVALAITAFRIESPKFKDTILSLSFVNFASLIDILRIIDAFQRIDDPTYGRKMSEEDPFLVRSFFTITSFSVSSSLHDVLMILTTENRTLPQTEKQTSKTGFLVDIPDVRRANLLILGRRMRLKFQILSFSFALKIADELHSEVIVDDVRIDSLTSDGPSLFEFNCDYHIMKPMTFASRSIQLTVCNHGENTRLIELDRFDIITTISVGKDEFYFSDMKLEINQSELLFKDVTLFQRLMKITEDVRSRITTTNNSAGGNTLSSLVGLTKHASFHVKKLKFAASFANPVKYFGGVDQSELNKYLRGFSVHLYDTGFTTDSCPSCGFTIKYYCTLIKLNLIHDFEKESVDNSFKQFFKTGNFRLVYSSQDNKISMGIPKIDAFVSIEVVWCVMFALKVMTSFIDKKPSSKSHSGPSLQYSINLGLLMLKLRLPTQIELAFEVDSLEVTDKIGSFRAIRVYATNPHTPNSWSPLIVFTRGKAMFNDYGEKDPIELIFDSVRLEIPFEYVFYKTFDNARAFDKAISQLKILFSKMMTVEEDNKSFSIPIKSPSRAEKPLRLPRLKIMANKFEFCMHDDPFEVQLTRCLLLGHVEQKVRLAKYNAFEKYANAMREKLAETYKELKFVDGKALNPLDTTSTDSEKPEDNEKSNKQELQEEYKQYIQDYHRYIEIPKNRLLANMSESWILRVINSGDFSYQDLRYSMGDPRVRTEFLDKFPVIIPGNVPPLFCLDISDFTLCIDEPSFGLENYAKFLYDIGDRIPKDSQYGILVPIHLNLQCSALELQVKDYPLPIIAFGGAESDDKSSINLDGDLVVIEQMYTPDELRYNFVPFVSQYNDPKNTDNFYAFHVARTLTNIKFVTKIDVQVDSGRPTVISWAPSFKPALSYMMNSFDVLSKPPIDSSPSIGFWDKIPLLFHARWKFYCKSGIDLFIKSGNSPYDYVGNAGGFLFRWQDNAVLTVNGNGKAKDFLVIESGKFEMTIPTFHIKSAQEALLCRGDGKRRYSVLKTLIKLENKPVIWKLGFCFERNRDNNCVGHPGFIPRTNRFIPHYEVRLKNPITFKNEKEKKNHDSYLGWRSDYIHMAVSVISKDNTDTRNSAYLTPLSFSRFFRWWDTFREGLGLPIKSGQLFSSNNEVIARQKSPGFGFHLFSISYQLDLSSVNIAHVYRNTADLRANSRVSFTGLKCMLENLLIDLHQSRRGKVVYDEDHREMGKDLDLKMTKGIMDFQEADIRIITSVFNQTSTAGILAKEYHIQNDSSDSSDSFSDTFSNYSSANSSQDSNIGQWFDKDDYVELDVPKLCEEMPKWRAMRLASSPRFYYVRDLGDSSFEFPFDEVQMRTHDCQLGKRKVSEEASRLAQVRIDDIQHLIAVKKSMLQKEPNSASLKKDLAQLEMKLEKLEELRSGFKEGAFTAKDNLAKESAPKAHGSSLTHCISKISSYTTGSIATDPDLTSMQASTYRNRFIIYNVEGVSDVRTKNLFLDYIDKINVRQASVFSLSHKAIILAENILSTPEKSRHNIPEGSNYTSELQSSASVIEDFDQVLHDTTSFNNAVTQDNYLLKFIFPQLRVNTNNETCLLAMANQLVLRSVGLENSSIMSSSDDAATVIETRSGLTVSGLNVYVLEREKALNNDYQIYSTLDHIWPPRLTFEMYYCPEQMSDSMVIRDLTAGAIFIKPNPLRVSQKDDSETNTFKESIRIVSPLVHITAKSEQYAAVFDTTMALMKYEKSESQKLKDIVKKIVKFSDTEDVGQIISRIQSIQQEIRQLSRCNEILRMSDENAYRESNTAISVQMEKDFLNLNALVGYLEEVKSVRYNDSFDIRKVILTAFNIELQLLKDDGAPFLNLTAVDTFYLTIQRPDGACHNEVCVYDFIARDKYEEAKYDTVICRYKDQESPMCFVDWNLLAPVGGITIIKSRTINFAPIKLQLDYRLAKEIYSFIFPKSSVDLDSKAISDMGSDDSAIDEMFDTPSMAGDDSISSLGMSSANSTVSTIDSDNSAYPKRKVQRSLGKILNRKGTSSSSSGVSLISKKKMDVKFRKKITSAGDNIAEMDRRAGMYVLGNVITINPMQLCLTFRGIGKLKLVNVTDMNLEIPKIELTNRLLSTEEFLAVFRIKILKIAIKNIPRFIQSKFKKDDNDHDATAEMPSSMHAPIGADYNIPMKAKASTTSKLWGVSSKKFLDPDLMEPGVERKKRSRPLTKRGSQ